MSESTQSVSLIQVQDYQFDVGFGAAGPALRADEPPPLGQGSGPSPVQLLAAAVGNCLSASLLFALRKFKQATGAAELCRCRRKSGAMPKPSVPGSSRKAAIMVTVRSPLKHLAPGWFAVVMGLAGLSLAWHAAVPVLGNGAGAGALVIGAVAAVVFGVLVAASLWRLRRHPEAWADDLQHPVRHVFVAAMPIALLLLVTAAVSAGLEGPVLEATWWAASAAFNCRSPPG